MEKRPNKLQRAVIYIKDIEVITGRKPGAARNLYLAILRHFEKSKGQLITFQEFSLFTGIDEEIIQDYLNS